MSRPKVTSPGRGSLAALTFAWLALAIGHPTHPGDPPPTQQSAPSLVALRAEATATPFATPRAHLPIALKPHVAESPTPTPEDGTLAYVNYFRRAAGVPAVTFDPTLNSNCWLHARYMAEENHLTHDERPNSPWYTPGGQTCAQKGNVWLGGAASSPYWQERHAIEGWMRSTGHRLWLLYPTTPTFGFGFYTAVNNRAGAALDVLSRFDSAADAAYPNWPVRYPGPGQTGLPTTGNPITLAWRYFGPTPIAGTISLTDGSGNAIPFTATTALPVGHKGIEIRPTQNLPPNARIDVSVSGSYDGQPFSYAWSFTTGN